VTFNDCQFSNGGATVVSNIPIQCRYTNCRFPEDNDDYMVTFFGGGRQTPSADAYGNVYADVTYLNGNAWLTARSIGLGTYGDSIIGGLKIVDYTNDKQVATLLGEGINSGANGNMYFGVNVANSNTNIMKLTYNHTLEPILDNAVSLGTGGRRMSVIYAATGTINTSDENTKQDIEKLNDVEKRVAIKLKGLIKKFRFKDAVEKKGDAARIHFGIIAQNVKDAFESENLIAENYGIFCKDEWFEINGNPAYPDENGKMPEEAIKFERLGVRYDELFAFIIASL